MSVEPYEIEEIEIGILVKEQVPSVRMSRERFVELVEELLESGEYGDSVRDKLIPVADTMPRFPFGAWITPERGCGCVVGEYLVATSEIDRFNLSRMLRQGNQMETVQMLLESNPDGEELQRFGGDIDDKLKRELFKRGLHSPIFNTCLEFIDDVTIYVRSIEIID